MKVSIYATKTATSPIKGFNKEVRKLARLYKGKGVTLPDVHDEEELPTLLEAAQARFELTFRYSKPGTFQTDLEDAARLANRVESTFTPTRHDIAESTAERAFRAGLITSAFVILGPWGNMKRLDVLEAAYDSGGGVSTHRATRELVAAALEALGVKNAWAKLVKMEDKYHELPDDMVYTTKRDTLAKEFGDFIRA